MRRSCTTAFLLAACAALGAPRPASAQAWGPGRGEASLFVGYTNALNKYHFSSTGEKNDRGRTTSHQAVVDLTYGLTDRVSLSVGLPYVGAKYEGAFPHVMPGHEMIDDGRYHGSLQDLRLEVRYAALDGPLAVTPFINGSSPVAEYEAHGHSAIGQHLQRGGIGVNVGWRPETVLPNAFVQGRYGFTLAEKILGVSHNASNVDVQLGYFVTSALSVRVGSTWLITHGGVDITPELRRTPYYEFHDQLIDDEHHDLSVGASWALSRSLDVHASAVRSLSGRNAHATERALSFGLSWSFEPGSIFGKKEPQVASAP